MGETVPRRAARRTVALGIVRVITIAVVLIVGAVSVTVGGVVIAGAVGVTLGAVVVIVGPVVVFVIAVVVFVPVRMRVPDPRHGIHRGTGNTLRLQPSYTL